MASKRIMSHTGANATDFAINSDLRMLVSLTLGLILARGLKALRPARAMGCSSSSDAAQPPGQKPANVDKVGSKNSAWPSDAGGPGPGPNDPLVLDGDFGWPSIVQAMRTQKILSGDNDVEEFLAYFGTDGGPVEYKHLKGKLLDQAGGDVGKVQELIDSADTHGGGTVGGADLENLLKTG